MQQATDDVIKTPQMEFLADGSITFRPAAAEAVMSLLIGSNDDDHRGAGLTADQSWLCLELAWAGTDIREAAAVLRAHAVPNLATVPEVHPIDASGSADWCERVVAASA